MKKAHQQESIILAQKKPLLALICIVVLVAGLLIVTYVSQRSLQQANTQRMQHAFDSRAKNVSYFLAERENNIRELASSKQVTSFFVNQALGMTKLYGLDASLKNVDRLFEHTVTSFRIGDLPIYSQFFLLDNTGLVLSGWPDGSLNEHHLPLPDEASSKDIKVNVTSLSPGVLFFTHPVMANGILQGYVQASVSYETIRDFLLGHSPLFITDRQRLVFQSHADISLDVGILRKIQDEGNGRPFYLCRNKQTTSIQEGHESNCDWALFAAKVPGYDITLFITEEGKGIGQQQAFYLFMALLVLLSVGGVLVAAMILRANMKSLVLATSLAEAEKRELAVAEKKEELEFIINGASLGTWNWEIRTGAVLFNKRWSEMLGYEPHELIGQVDTWSNLVHPDDIDVVTQNLQAHLRGETPVYIVEHRLRHKSGRWIWVLDTGKVFKRDQDGEPLQALGIHLDITAQKESQILIANAKEEADTIIRDFLDTLIVVHRDLTIARVSHSTCQLLGYDANELIGQPITMLFHDPEDLVTSIFSFYEEDQEDIFDSCKELRNIELTYKTKTYVQLPMSVNISILKDEAGMVIGVVAGAKDISSIKSAMETIARQKEYIEYLFDIVPQGLLTLDQSMQIGESNKAFKDIIRNLAAVFHSSEPGINQKIQEKLQIVLAKADSAIFTLSRNNNTAYFQYYASTVPALEGIEYIVAIKDITQERKDEAARRLLATVVEQTADSVVLTEIDGTIRYVNPATVRHSGYGTNELIGKNPRVLQSGLTPVAIYKELWQTILQGHVWSGHLSNCKKDGTIIEEDVTISPVRNEDGELTHFVAIKRDITDIGLMQRQLLQAQKLEAIGQLAAGIAHEINTPMQYVQNNVSFFTRALSDLSLLLADYQQLQKGQEASLSEEARNNLARINMDFLMEEIPEGLAEIQEGINRVITIVSAMRELSHPGTGEKLAINLNKSVESTIVVSTNEWKYVAEIATDLDHDLPMVPCLPDQLNQVLLNLIVNAAQAIEETGASVPANPGRITISTIQDGNWVEIRIGDTGGGIPAKNRDKVFEPFFTTKEVGKGTGQGLAIAHDVIVGKHGGTLEFVTESERGTTFIIRLPLSLSLMETE